LAASYAALARQDSASASTTGFERRARSAHGSMGTPRVYHNPQNGRRN
jgi:hypothetical protein